MAKFYGNIGYSVTEETSPGVYEERYVDRKYRGDITRMSRALKEAQKVNDDVTISNVISIVADTYAYENIYAIRYVEWAGAKWKVTSIEVQRPRLTLTIGGVFNDGD